MSVNPKHVFPLLLTLLLAGMAIGAEPAKEKETIRQKNNTPVKWPSDFRHPFDG